MFIVHLMTQQRNDTTEKKYRTLGVFTYGMEIVGKIGRNVCTCPSCTVNNKCACSVHCEKNIFVCVCVCEDVCQVDPFLTVEKNIANRPACKDGLLSFIIFYY